MKCRNCFVILVLLALSVPAALAQQSSTQQSTTDQKKTTKAADKTKHDQHHEMQGSKMPDNKAVPAPDRTFMMKAAEGGMAEVALGELATKQAGSDDVKQFGQRMVDDHGKANRELMDLAARKGVTLPSDMGAKEKALKTKLEKLSGAEFDREYMREMLKDHEKDVAMFEKEAKNGRDAEVKAWAEQTLPTLRDHLKLARETASKTGTHVSQVQKTGKKGTK
ncbi:MAG TPA: DUF4142 domain-containing protein [Blastocatellia bacterium]|nr:DUF4142 domain-containing protein [Blastocatellia bacterium]